MAFRTATVLFLALGTSLLLLVGCGQSKPSRFYMLTALSAPDSSVTTLDRGVSIAVGPVRLPEYLDRQEIVTRSSTNEMELAGFDRWAEPLDAMVSRVVTENLSILLKTDRVVMLPVPRLVDFRYQLVIDIIRFDRDVDGSSVLIARWKVLDREDEAELLSGRSSYRERAADESYVATVAAMNRALDGLSQEIAAAMSALR